MIDHKTIKALTKKSESAFEDVYHQTKRGVYSVIFSVVKNHEETQDLMQEVYMKMMQNIDKYQPKTNFVNWLFTLAKNVAIDHYRRAKKVQTIDDIEYQDIFVSQEESPASKDHFTHMIELLTEEQRIIVLLKIVDDKKFKDIAAIVDKPLGTVLWQYQEALKVLKGYEGIS
ncbi:MAG: RNA polymerase sigma factor [Acholeplasmataceae bacterium]